ncbi:TIR domain-containing protein [Agathobacter rectalis]|uniref:TIR domain-containing protein n=1 Tax=Agathobacter rectalis TaxID=39491 RepID=A0A3E4E9Y3_9FIRM|nr:toll/interleukin-1 receptor domain-containing protein [Agathobacter rectalis]RGI67538.1 TIR domain-containing protein [Agathobacter rectalis]
MEYRLSYITKNEEQLDCTLKKIFFCSHWNDLDKLPKIAKLVFDDYKCSIWFHNKYDYVLDSCINESLSSMALFIIPVTSVFLSTDNTVILKEIEFALNNNVPILPIIFEKGIDDIFAEKFGNIQYISILECDITAIDFKIKIKRFLNSILIGEELVDKIRDAFEAYVFISYRKCNRKYANELMQMLHQNKTLRSLAVWYDEYLIPGENFNIAIDRAIKKSGVFALVVTPDILQDPNYVKDIEYPYAMALKKDIIPVEMANTNHAELEKKYHGIKKVINKNDVNNLYSVFLDIVRKSSLKINKDNILHSFFLGLAYLEGIDVEINYQYAKNLIEEAAKRGISDAIKKIFEMYSDGYGVNRDLKLANKWGKILLEKLINREKNNSVLLLVFEILVRLAENYIEVGEINTGRVKYQLILDLTENRNVYIFLIYRLFTFKHLALLEKDEGNLLLAEELMLEGENTLKEIYSSKQDNLVYIHDEISFYHELGDIALLQENYVKSRKYFSAALTLSKKNMSLDKSVNTEYDLVRSYRNMAWLEFEFYHLKEAKNYCVEALGGIERAEKKIIVDENDFFSEKLSLFRLLSLIYQENDCIDKALECINVAVVLINDNNRDLINDKINSIIVCLAYGEAYLRKNIDEALEILKCTLNTCESMFNKFRIRKLAYLLVENYYLLGEAYKEENDYYKSIFFYKKALSVVGNEVPNVLNDKVRLLSIYLELAQLYIQQTNIEKGLQYLKKGQEFAFKLVYCKNELLGNYEIKKIRGEVKIHYILAQYFELLAEYEDNVNNEKLLLYWAKKSIKYAYEEHLKYHGDTWGGDKLYFSLCRKYATINYRYGVLCKKNNIEVSNRLFSKSIELLSYGNIYLVDKAITCICYAKFIYNTVGNISKVISLLKIALECAVKMCDRLIPGCEKITLKVVDSLLEYLLLEKKFDEMDDIFELFKNFNWEEIKLSTEEQKTICQIYNNMSYYYFELHDINNAKKCCEMVIKFREAINEYDKIRSINDLGRAYSNYAWILFKSADWEKAEKFLFKAINLQIDAINTDNNKYREDFVRTCNRLLLYFKKVGKEKEVDEIIDEALRHSGIIYDTVSHLLIAGVSIDN